MLSLAFVELDMFIDPCGPQLGCYRRGWFVSLIVHMFFFYFSLVRDPSPQNRKCLVSTFYFLITEWFLFGVMTLVHVSHSFREILQYLAFFDVIWHWGDVIASPVVVFEFVPHTIRGL